MKVTVKEISKRHRLGQNLIKHVREKRMQSETYKNNVKSNKRTIQLKSGWAIWIDILAMGKRIWTWEVCV